VNIIFIKNNDLLIWNLLYGSSVSLKVHAFKQKLWLTYKNQYQKIENDKDEILKDPKNFIPDDNTLYDLLSDTKVFEKIESDTEKERLEFIKAWDKHKVKINKTLKDVLKCTIPNIQVIILYPQMDAILTKEKTTTIAWARKNSLEDEIETLLEIIKTAYLNMEETKNEIEKQITEATLELAILNECYTRLNKSNYKTGNKKIRDLKLQIYPYFLMYLGYELEEMTSFMMRDNIPFDIENYENNEDLKELNIKELIEFLVKNQKKLLNIKKEKDNVEVL